MGRGRSREGRERSKLGRGKAGQRGAGIAGGGEEWVASARISLYTDSQPAEGDSSPGT